MSEQPNATVLPVPTDMPTELKEIDNSNWTSTYSVLTADRTLGRLNVVLESHELLDAIKNPENAYFQILRVPMQNIFNGIILQQAIDYQVYAQKLYVDYLLSGEGNKDETSPGADAREALEIHRLSLVALGESFAELQLDHKMLISESQAYLKEKAKELNPARPSQLNNEVKDAIDSYAEKALRIRGTFCDARSQFYALILTVTQLLNNLPDFHIDEAKIVENREPLYFDANIGDDTLPNVQR